MDFYLSMPISGKGMMCKYC